MVGRGHANEKYITLERFVNRSAFYSPAPSFEPVMGAMLSS